MEHRINNCTNYERIGDVIAGFYPATSFVVDYKLVLLYLTFF